MSYNTIAPSRVSRLVMSLADNKRILLMDNVHVVDEDDDDEEMKQKRKEEEERKKKEEEEEAATM